jgi:hypothetical protein
MFLTNLSLVAPASNLQSEINPRRATPTSFPVPPQITKSSRYPSPRMSLAEQFQARREREEAAHKLFSAVSLNKVAEGTA